MTSNATKRRDKLIKKGNTHCPICLVDLREENVVATLEHAPPKAAKGRVVCLTCEGCNNRASVSDREFADSLKGEWQAEFEINGYKRSVRVYQKGIDESKLPSDPKGLLGDDEPVSMLTIESSELPANVIKQVLVKRHGLDPEKVDAGLLKSAYLMVFSLMGRGGYWYAQSHAVRPIREQIMRPDRGGASLRCRVPDPIDELPSRAILLLQSQPCCWIVKIDDSCVLLPRGGSLDQYERLASRSQGGMAGLDVVVWDARQVEFEGCPTRIVRCGGDYDDWTFGTMVFSEEGGRARRWVVVNRLNDIAWISEI